MKKILLTALSLVVFAGIASAHPPSLIEIAAERTTVTVKITHHVSDPVDHHIGLVEVFINDTPAVTQTLSTQTDDKTQNVMYTIPGLKSKDKILVKATCNKGGEKADILLVP